METAPAILSHDADVDMPYLLNACPHLEAIYHETLRFTNSATSIRSVTAPTVIGSTKLPLHVGTKVLSPFRQLHFDETVFGDDACEFKFDRFLRPENAKLANRKSYRPFGGGSTYCPGRFVAKQEVFMFVAVALARFDICTVSTVNEHANGLKNGRGEEEVQTFPRLDLRKPSLGVMGPVGEDDLILQVTPR